MLQATTIKFLKDLKKNNNKEWFEKNKKVYETAKQDFVQLTADVILNLSKVDANITNLEAKKCIFRINRDVRFSKEKSPYKTNFGMSLVKGGKNATNAGYYFHLQPGECFVGGGLYMPMPDDVKKIRQEIDYNFSEFKKVIGNKKFAALYKDLTITPEFSLVRPPKGYDENNEAIKYIKLKSWVTTVKITDETLTSKDLCKKIVTAFETIKPLVDFINNAIDE